MELSLATSDESRLLSAVPEHLSISDMLKATPVEEGGRRFVYLEASNEAVDYQGEVVLAKALGESSDYYLRYGNLDIDHFTQVGHKLGVPDYASYEIGRPVEVKAHAGSTFVKGEIFKGDGPAAMRANIFWSSLTEIQPPARWYPSVGGKVMAKSVVADEHGMKRAVIEKVRWTNIGFSKTPVNLNVGTVGTVPFGVLAKSMLGSGWDFAKAMEAGYGTDAASLEGGAALRKQSLDKGLLSYWDFRDGMATLIRAGSVNGGRPSDLVKVAREHFGMGADEAAASVERFLSDIENHRRLKNG